MENLDKFQLSSYQQDILDFVRTHDENMLIDAKAGSGKTSTLLLIANEIIKQNKKCLFLAFNKHIVEELKTKIDDPNCMIKTVHSLGLTFIRSFLYRKHQQNYQINMDTSKTLNLVKQYFNEICYQDYMLALSKTDKTPQEIKDLTNDIISEIRLMVDQVRFYNVNYRNKIAVEDLASKKCFYLALYSTSYGLDRYSEVIEKVIDRIKYDFENPEKYGNDYIYNIDFTDMIYLPTFYNMYTPASIKQYLDYILVDETQDLSVLQQNFISLLNNGSSRRIFVGDRNQSIYGFAGADCNSIPKLKIKYNVTELPLNICYRCPENVVRLAQLYVPNIEWNTDRPDKGAVEIVESNFYKKLQPDDIIICRYNRDVLYLYRKLTIDENIMVKLKNIEQVKGIINQVTRCCTEYIDRYNKYGNYDKSLYEYFKCTPEQCNVTYLTNTYDENKIKDAVSEIKAIEKQNKKPIQKNKFNIKYLKLAMQEYKEKGAYYYEIDSDLTQYFNVIEAYIDMYDKKCNNLDVKDFINYLEDVLKGNLDRKLPTLSTVHMMKGSEADNIYMYDFPRFPNYPQGIKATPENLQQEENLSYVGITRAKKNLYLCSIDIDRVKELFKHKPLSLEDEINKATDLNASAVKCLNYVLSGNLQAAKKVSNILS